MTGVVFEVHCQWRTTAATACEARYRVGRQDGDYLCVRIGTESIVHQQRDVVGSPRIVGVEDGLVRCHLSAIAKAPVLDGVG